MANIEHLTEAWSRVDQVAHDLLVPIENHEQYERVLSTIDDLMAHVGEADTGPHPLESLLGILIERVAAYEDVLVGPRARRPEAVLAYLMGDRDLTQSALARETGIDQSTLSKLLKGERAFSKTHIKTLSAYFHVGPEAFIA